MAFQLFLDKLFFVQGPLFLLDVFHHYLFTFVDIDDLHKFVERILVGFEIFTHFLV